ncbi:MAG: Tetrathionate response regulatory protein TtrR [Pseudomonadota bacterium]
MTNSKGNVYIVEDDDSIRKALNHTLNIAGYNVRTFSIPTQFLSNLNIEHPAVIILDMLLPEMSGISVQIEILKNYQSIPIIFISGESSLDQAIFAMKHGAIDFLIKPFLTKDLIPVIEKGLGIDLKNINQKKQQESLNEKLKALTSRELEVYQLLLKGFSNQEIMNELNLALPTTKQYKSQVMRKLKIKSFSELIELNNGEYI